MRLVSGSPVATETGDMNTSIMDAAGDAFVVGCYSLAKASTMTAVVRDILENYQENPGIGDGDAFICNDPTLAPSIRTTTALVMPVFVDGTLIAWSGAELHIIDVGGPTAGQVQIGARDIFGEAPLVAPIKILEGDTLRRDLEREYLRRSRLPELMGLDLRAKIAAATVARRRLQDVAAEYGTDVLRDAMADMLDYAETRFRQRLAELPDWHLAAPHLHRVRRRHPHGDDRHGEARRRAHLRFPRHLEAGAGHHQRDPGSARGHRQGQPVHAAVLGPAVVALGGRARRPREDRARHPGRCAVAGRRLQIPPPPRYGRSASR